MPTAVKQVPCPTCGGPSLYLPSNRFRPFCSQRCQQVDLGAWASESFTLPQQASDPHPDPDLEQH